MWAIFAMSMGEPAKLEVDIVQWKQRRFQTLAFFGALDSDMHDDVMQCESHPSQITFQGLSSEKQNSSRVVFYASS